MKPTMESFALATVGDLLDAAAYNVAQAIKQHDEAAVHKLRVSIRRLQQALRLFRQYLDARESRRVRKQLRRFLKAASEVRNRDIAMMLAAEAGVNGAVIARLESERKASLRALRGLLRGQASQTGKWRARIGVNGQ